MSEPGSMRGRKRRLWVIAGVSVAVAVVVGAWLFQPWLLWVDEEVSEALPPAATAKGSGTPSSSVPANDETTSESSPAGATESAATEMAIPEPRDLGSGEFISAEHSTTGSVRVVDLGDGSRVLRLEGLETSNGPDLKVWLTDRPSGGDCQGCRESWGIYDDGAYADLGPLKGNRGDQNYEIPADVDPADLPTVVIWCDRFNVAFGTAALDLTG